MVQTAACSAAAEGEEMTTSDRFRGAGTLLVKAAEQSAVEYEITLFDIEQITQAEGWIEASAAVLEYAQSATGAQLRLVDGRTVDVTIGRFIDKGSPSRARLIVHDGWQSRGRRQKMIQKLNMAHRQILEHLRS
jgi:hypothetical protein